LQERGEGAAGIMAASTIWGEESRCGRECGLRAGRVEPRRGGEIAANCDVGRRHREAVVDALVVFLYSSSRYKRITSQILCAFTIDYPITSIELALPAHTREALQTPIVVVNKYL
jgi:hypothetical protein